MAAVHMRIDVELMARACPRLNLRVEHTKAVPPFRLGLVEREVGVLEQVLAAAAVLRRERDADAGADAQRVAVEPQRFVNRLEQPPREPERLLALRTVGALQDREFVAAEPRHEVGLAGA